jgi:hypothetical protein
MKGGQHHVISTYSIVDIDLIEFFFILNSSQLLPCCAVHQISPLVLKYPHTISDLKIRALFNFSYLSGGSLQSERLIHKFKLSGIIWKKTITTLVRYLRGEDLFPNLYKAP